MAVTISSFFSAVLRTKMKNSRMGISRLPSGPSARITASLASSGVPVSASGEALTMLPMQVARLRTCLEPTDSAALPR